MNRFMGINFAIITFACIGCGGDSFPDPVPVTGVIKHNGQAVEGASVTFHTKASGAARSASGVTNASGEFALSTFGTDDGAIPGEYAVTISKSDGEAGSVVDIGDGENMGEDYAAMMDNAATAAAKNEINTTLPKKYATTDKSGLNRTVGESGSNHFEFDLK